MRVTNVLSCYLSFSLIMSLWILAPQTAFTQDTNWGGARGTSAKAIGQQWRVGVSSADIFAGPSVAYTKQGRVYEGELVMILEVTRSQEWAQVSTKANIRGWIKVSELNRPQDQVAQDPGRYRRQTQYQYDTQGRRIDKNGQAVGSGQGTGAPMPSAIRFNNEMVDPNRAQRNPMNIPRRFSGDRNEPSSLMVSLPVGMTHFTRRFTSNIGTSPLSGLKSQVASASFGLAVTNQFNSYLILSARLIASMGSEVPLPSVPALTEIGEVNLKANQQQGELLLGVGTPIKVGFADYFWLGGVLGAQYYQTGYTMVQYPAPAERMAPLQNHTYLSALVGPRLIFHWDKLSWDIQGGVGLPLSFKQSPNSEGQWQSLGLWAQTGLHFLVTDHFKVGANFGYLRIGSEYTGPAKQADFSLGEPIYYTEASGYDQSIEGLLYLSYSL